MNRVETREDNLEERVKPLKSSMSRRSFFGHVTRRRSRNHRRRTVGYFPHGESEG
jgi:hypothetical protein